VVPLGGSLGNVPADESPSISDRRNRQRDKLKAELIISEFAKLVFPDPGPPAST
jgi:hypothetical protein